MTNVRVARIYDPPDGTTRVLVDRLWPRGLSKEAAHLDIWCKDIAPSSNLRSWYGHRPELFDEFTQRYSAELEDDQHAEALTTLIELLRAGATLTLLTATRDLALSHAAILAAVLENA